MAVDSGPAAEADAVETDVVEIVVATEVAARVVAAADGVEIAVAVVADAGKFLN